MFDRALLTMDVRTTGRVDWTNGLALLLSLAHATKNAALCRSDIAPVFNDQGRRAIPYFDESGSESLVGVDLLPHVTIMRSCSRLSCRR